ncbi:RHS repeat-associated core domain-containing protein [Hoylesella buccalis]|uniref:RHS repeat-associated core domain-containing protein n=1 Tax=Hoylesella buccalis TaxID=28127 RepID=UPI001D157761|nr:RHS repeat-associated core domain-containing protein [Hoylesella buccalis]UEA62661.1 RHS repeat-associated core domain-containing protein [Hoylesella buccalis]UWP50053.1 RHS repeat-associated core domain-containing protein [Hoylesella buccalis ATCC 35310]
MLYTKLDGDVPDWELIFYVGIVSNWNCQKRKSAIIKNAKAGTIMDNAYSYDAVSNVLGIQNNAPLPQSGKAGGQISHSYTYDPLYRLSSATGTYKGADNKTASYTLAMGYDNMHRITSKKQHLTQSNVQFNGTLNAGYDLTYTYNNDEGKKFQLASVRDINYRTEETPTDSTNINNGHKYTYDANGNLVYINTSRVKHDGKEDEKATEQKYKWDEENRLLAADENGFVSNYWYDADGERTVKTSGENEAIFVNSEFSGGNTGTARFSLYVSPYLVAGQGGKYTKHIYVGSQRIVSKLGDLASYGADPRRIPYAGNEADGLTINYKDKYNQQLQSIKDNYKTFDLPYSGKDNDDYVNGKGFSSDDDTPETSQARAMVKTRAGEAGTNERLQFYYHHDHLGSSSYITNLDGEVSQHIEYVPFGEVFIEERNNTWNTPYLFNAKELDEETGLYYYGARYMDPKISMWLGVDPLMEKYPSVTGYCYTMDNPIRFIDPDGRDGMVTGNGTETDPYIITAKYFYKKGTLDESQKQGLNDAINAYNNLGGGSGIKVKEQNRTFYAKYNLSAEEVKDVNEARLNTCFETTSGEPRYYGNIVGTEVYNGNEYGSANNFRIDFNVENIKKGIEEGIDSRDINTSTAIHEIGHNLGAEHSDKTSVMKLLDTIERTSIEGKTLKTYDFPKVDKNSIKVLFNKRDTPKADTSNGRLWTKKVN